MGYQLTGAQGVPNAGTEHFGKEWSAFIAMGATISAVNATRLAIVIAALLVTSTTISRWIEYPLVLALLVALRKILDGS